MTDRLYKLRIRLQQEEIDAILISQAENRRYLSGFTGSAGFLLVSQDKALLATDSRYTEQAENQAPDFEIFPIFGDMSQWFAELTSLVKRKRIGIETDDISYSTYQRIIGAAGGKQIIPTEGIVESLRAIKDDEEVRCIRKAAEISDAAFEKVAQALRPGMTEREAAWELEKAMREGGSESVPFDIIVASGPNAAMPHHRPAERVMQKGEPVVIDMGARVNGYASDLSRTICLGDKGDKRFDKIYDLVLGAQLTAIATIEAGMTGELADSLAREVIEQGRYGENFGHGLGHGIGLAPHELPRLGRGSRDILDNGMVFSIEPGIYVNGWGGVRIEDLVTLREGKIEVISKAKK